MSKSKRKSKMKDQLDNMKSGGGKGLVFLKADTTLRMRPLPIDPDESIGIEVIQFYLGGTIKGVISPASFGEPCAIMDMHNELMESSDEDDKNLAGNFKPRKRYAVGHIVYKDLKGKDVDKERGPCLYLLNNDQYQDLVEYYFDEDEHGDFTDPKNGYDIKYKRVGSGQFDTNYSILTCKPTKLPKEYTGKVYDVTEMLNEIIPSYEDTEKYIKQYLKLDNDIDDDKESKKKKKKIGKGTAGKKSKKKKKK